MRPSSSTNKIGKRINRGRNKIESPSNLSQNQNINFRVEIEKQFSLPPNLMEEIAGDGRNVANLQDANGNFSFSSEIEKSYEVPSDLFHLLSLSSPMPIDSEDSLFLTNNNNQTSVTNEFTSANRKSVYSSSLGVLSPKPQTTVGSQEEEMDVAQQVNEIKKGKSSKP